MHARHSPTSLHHNVDPTDNIRCSLLRRVGNICINIYIPFLLPRKNKNINILPPTLQLSQLKQPGARISLQD